MTEEQKQWAKITKQLRGAMGCVAAAIAGWPFKGAAYRTTRLVRASMDIKDALEEADWYVANAEAVAEFERDKAEQKATVEGNGQS